MAPKRIRLITGYILNNFDRKTYRGDKTYIYNTLTNIPDVASGKKGAVEEIKQKQRVSGFNSIFAVASVLMAKLYYQGFKKHMEVDTTKKLRIATIYSYGANEEDYDGVIGGILDEENSEDTSALDKSSRDFLEDAIKDYGEIKTTGTEIDKLMPAVSRFGGGSRAAKKQTVIDKLKAFFEKFYGIGGSFADEKSKIVNYDIDSQKYLGNVADKLD